jgi:hypothetical protein
MGEDNSELETSLGYENFREGPDRLGWLMNISTSSVEDFGTEKMHSCVNCYFMCQDGTTFKCQVKFEPYFYVGVKDNAEAEVEAYLRRKYEGRISDTAVVEKEDLDLKNHLAGHRHKYLKVHTYLIKFTLTLIIMWRRKTWTSRITWRGTDISAYAHPISNASASSARVNSTQPHYLDQPTTFQRQRPNKPRDPTNL